MQIILHSPGTVSAQVKEHAFHHQLASQENIATLASSCISQQLLLSL